jgi:hypothetical protein
MIMMMMMMMMMMIITGEPISCLRPHAPRSNG